MDKKGFTIIEMLIVVVIIGVLSSVVLPRVTGSALESRRKSCTAQILSINETLEFASYEKSIHPSAIDGDFPDQGLFTAIGALSLANFSDYFVQGGMNCPIDTRKYYIEDGRVDKDNATAMPAYYHIDGVNH